MTTSVTAGRGLMRLCATASTPTGPPPLRPRTNSRTSCPFALEGPAGRCRWCPDARRAVPSGPRWGNGGRAVTPWVARVHVVGIEAEHLLDVSLSAVPTSCARARDEIGAALQGLAIDIAAVALARSEGGTKTLGHALPPSGGPPNGGSRQPPRPTGAHRRRV